VAPARARARGLPALGAALALKLIAWPLVLFLLVTRRWRGAALACLSGAFFLLLPWAAIGFRGLAGYPHLLSTANDWECGDA
jgi:hypothetical protein